jgi:signal transduction histidine kinase
MKRTFPRQPRILFLFIGGIGLPSLLLGYLAFRGIKNDQALIEKDRIEEHRRIAGQIVRVMDDGLSQVERTFQDILVRIDKESLPVLLPELQALKKKYPLVEEIFTFQGPSKTDFPCAPLLYRTQARPSVSDGAISSPAQSRALEQGEQQEFRSNDSDQALLFYRQALKGALNSQARGEVLIRIARVQKKSGGLGQALETYRMIAEDCDQVPAGAGLPLGLVARLEMGALFLKLNNPSRVLKTQLDLYKELLNGRWPLDKGEFDFAIQKTIDAIGDILSRESLPDELAAARDAFHALEDRERTERIRTERYLLFQNEAPRALEWRTSLPQKGFTEGKKRFSLEAGRERYLISLIPRAAEKAGGHEIWGLMLAADQLLNRLLEELKSGLPEGKTGWALKDREENVLASSSSLSAGTLTVKADFKENFPDWTLEFYHPDVPFFEALLTSRRAVYLVMFLSIAGILAFGFVLTIRSLTREVELARMKSDFVSTVSHEFKSPLTSIRQIAEMLEAGRVPSESRRQRYYEVLLEQSERLSLLTDNVLSFAKMEAGKKEFDFEVVDAGALLRELVSAIQDRVRHEGFEIETTIADSLPPVLADVSAISQAITNLIDNAVKYSAGSRKILVKTYVEHPHLVVAVQDFGVGIRKDEMDKIFDRFYRGGDELTRTVKGSGLGLTLVKQIVEAHQGSIKVESEPGKGSVFSIKLPLDGNKG